MRPSRAITQLRPFGEAAILVELADSGGRITTRRIHALAARVEAQRAEAIRAVTPGFTSLLVEYDPLVVERSTIEATVRAALEEVAATADVASTKGRQRVIPVVYGDDFGPDLGEVADLTGLDVDDVVERHAATAFEVYLLGFAPGYAYLGDLPADLDVPRLATPRARTPSGSVAIAGRHCGIYPSEEPGGWRVIGRTPLRMFDVTRSPPVYLLPGDAVAFRRIDRDEFDTVAPIADDW